MHGLDLGMIEVNEAPPPVDLTPEEVTALADELVHYHAAFAERDYRKEQAQWGDTYLPGLMLPLERKSSAPMALALAGGDVPAMPPVIGQGQWQEEAWLRQPWALVDETLGAADGVCIVEGADCPQQGEHAVGVARQWCGRLGKDEHGQAGVCAAYASRTGYTLLDRRLSLPDAWCDAAHRERWHKCGGPEDPLCKTTPPLALGMLRAGVQASTVRLRWGTCEETVGREPTCLDGVAAVQRRPSRRAKGAWGWTTMRSGVGWGASSYDSVPLGPACPGAGPTAAKKRAPALTVWQALVLVASLLPQKPLTPPEALERGRYLQEHNHAAYLSHRRRILERWDGL